MFSFLSNLWDLLFPKAWYIDGTKFIGASNEVVRMSLLLLTRPHGLDCNIWAFKWNALRDHGCHKEDFIARAIKGDLLNVCAHIPVNPNNSIVIVIGDYRQMFDDVQQRCIVIKPKEGYRPILFIGSKDSLYQALDKIPELDGIKNIIEIFGESIKEA